MSSPGFNLRAVQPGDNAALARIIRQVFYEFDAPRTGTVFADPDTDHLFELFQKKGAVLWVAELNELVVGCCGIYPTEGLNPDTAELVKFYLDATARGCGLGRALLEKSLQSVRELGYRHCYLESLPVFGKSVRLYEQQGFRRVDQRLGNSGHSSCDIWMIKDL
jgi:putative acetyltransferase